MEKCKKCGQKDGIHKMSCESIKLTIMGDITKCKGDNCKVKESCYRYTAESKDFWKSWLTHPPIDKDGKCGMYLGINK